MSRRSPIPAIGRAAAAGIGVSERSDRPPAPPRRCPQLRSRLRGGAAGSARARSTRPPGERAIEGTIKRHYYHGELKSEERVYDNRLLIYLLGKTEHLLGEPAEAAAVAENWEPFVEAMEQGLPPPDLRSDQERARDDKRAGRWPHETPDEAEADDDDDDDEDNDEDEDDDEDLLGEAAVWEEDGLLMTHFPPPAGFDSDQIGVCGDPDYRRPLSDAEEAAFAAKEREEDQARAEAIGRARVRRDLYFGFEGGLDEVGPARGGGRGRGRAGGSGDSRFHGSRTFRTFRTFRAPPRSRPGRGRAL